MARLAGIRREPMIADTTARVLSLRLIAAPGLPRSDEAARCLPANNQGCQPARQASSTAPHQTPAEDSTFREIYDANLALVCNALRRQAVREADVPDLAQKVFIIAFLKLSGFEERSKLGTWLFGICRCVAGDYRKAAYGRHEVITDSTEMDVLEGSGSDPSAQLDTAEAFRAAEAMLECLPPV